MVSFVYFLNDKNDNNALNDINAINGYVVNAIKNNEKDLG